MQVNTLASTVTELDVRNEGQSGQFAAFRALIVQSQVTARWVDCFTSLARYVVSKWNFRAVRGLDSYSCSSRDRRRGEQVPGNPLCERKKSGKVSSIVHNC